MGEKLMAELNTAKAAQRGKEALTTKVDETAALRDDLESLTRQINDLSKDSQVLDVRLRKYRARAAADLERAVPLSTSSFWQHIDGPTMKVVTLLVRSSCLRRTFALHLLGTYLWLFFLMFWLEHQQHHR